MPKVVPEYKEEARQRILTTASRAFSERGYRQTTMEDIAEMLGVSKGALYLYFGSKEELFREMCTLGHQALRETLRASFRAGDLKANAEVFFERMSQQPVWTPRLASEVLPETWRDAALRRIVRESYDVILGIVRGFLESQRQNGLLKRDLDTRALAQGLVAVYDGLMVALVTGVPREEARRAWAEAIRVMLFGALRVPSPRA